MADSQVRVGFVGCGVHAREVILPAAQHAGLEFAAVCDLDKRLAQRVSRRFGAFRAYQDLGNMIDEMDLDAVLVCGPPEMHAEAAEIALSHGCHVWTEMPAAPTAEEVVRIADLADARGLVAQPGLMTRFAPACVRLREIVSREEFGPLHSIEVAWWPQKQHGHDDPMLFDLPHALDLVRFIGGEVSRLCVARATGDDSLAVAMQLQSGAVATVSFGAPAACPRERVAVASANAVATAEDRQTVTLRHCEREETSVWAARACETSAEGNAGGAERVRGFLPAMEQFAAAVAGGDAQSASMRDAARALRLAEHVSANSGEMVDVG